MDTVATPVIFHEKILSFLIRMMPTTNSFYDFSIRKALDP